MALLENCGPFTMTDTDSNAIHFHGWRIYQCAHFQQILFSSFEIGAGIRISMNEPIWLVKYIKIATTRDYSGLKNNCDDI